MTEPVIEMRDVGVAYRLMRDHVMSLQDYTFAFLRRRVSYEQHWALHDVSLEVRPGELVGVVGANGAGKTTLLKIVGRVVPPSKGRVIVRGTVAPMIELGAGFNTELTGLENIVLYGALLGHEPRWLMREAERIADYAGVVDYLDVPLRAYSSGMVARLAFAVATVRSPDVLLVDEVLAVGDESFRVRSQRRLEEMMADGTAVLLVTHALDHVTTIADRAIWLEAGRIAGAGSPHDVVAEYRERVAERELEEMVG